MPNRSPVLYFTRFVPAYRVPVLNRLNSALDGRLVICAGNPPRQSSVLKAMDDQPREYERVDLHNHWFRHETLHYQNFKRAFEIHPHPSAIIAEEAVRSITLPFLLAEAKRRKAGRVLWGIFYSFHRQFSPLHPLQAYRLHLARTVESCACYTKGVRDVIAPHIDNSKLFVAQNTLETDILSDHYQDLKSEGKTKVRQRLGINPSHNVITFVGQLIPSKGTRELIDVFEHIQENGDATLLVIGDGPDRGMMEELVATKGLENVKFLGAIAKLEDSSPYIFASDVMLIPGYVGLVVNHALWLGVPVVTQKPPGKSPYHAPEVESIVDGSNGLITDRNSSSLTAGVSNILANQNLYSENAIDYARKHITTSIMVKGLADAVRHAEQQVINAKG